MIVKILDKDTLLTTASGETTKEYNLYDVAGNTWKWTEESSFRGGNVAKQYTVVHGGSFNNSSSSNPVCYRNGIQSDGTAFSIAFRVVLYMK